MTLERDTILNKRYRIQEILGEGGMGAVYKALDETLGVTVAVKENLFTTAEYSRQFRVEAQILATLRHPNLTRVTDHFIQDDIQYIVMDYIDGEDLRDRMERLGILDEDEVIKIGASLCDALTYLHNLNPNILHRDVKPGNVRISPDGQVFLVDFGLAKIVQGNQMTVTGARAMTPGYSPPEQYGTARTDARSDIYSLGATLYSALTAALPEDGLARAMNQTELTPVRKHNPKIPRKLASVIETSLAVQPDDRFQSADEFRKALVAARGITSRRLRPEELVVPPPPIPSKARRAAEKRTAELADAYQEDLDQRGPDSGRLESAAPPLSFSTGSFNKPPELSRATRARRLRSRLVWLFALVLVGGGVGAFAFVPGLSSQALALLTAPTPTRPATPTDIPASPTSEPPTATATEAAVEAPTEALVVLPPSATPTITKTPPPTPSPTITPTPRGGSSLIAFASDRSGITQIWLMDTSGESLVQLTDISGGACQPDWSPDGTRLVFISPCTGEQEDYPGSALFMINVDGTGLTPVLGSRAGDYDPDWSPDGSQIAFTSLRDSEPQVFLLNLDDNSVTVLAVDGLKNYQPAWSPDGSLIAFITNRRGPFMVYTMKPDGTEQEGFSRSAELKDNYPDWSPDGKYIVFSQREVLNGTPSLVLAPFEDDGFSEIRLTIPTSPARSPEFSPDGKFVIFEGWPDGENHDIYLLDLSSLTTIRLTTQSSFEFDAAWQPLP